MHLERVDHHRLLGVAGAGIAVGVVVTGLWTIAQRVPRMVAMGTFEVEVGPVVFGNLATLVAFSACVTRGIALRRQPAMHKRLMLLASISIVAQATTRIGQLFGLAPFALGIPGEAALALTLVAHDLWTLRRVHPATIFGIAWIVLTLVAAVVVGRSAAGRAVVEILAR